MKSSCRRLAALLTIALALAGSAIGGCSAKGTSNEAAQTATQQYLQALAQGDQARLDVIGIAPVNIKKARVETFGGQTVADVRIDRFRMQLWYRVGDAPVDLFIAQVRVSAAVDGQRVTRSLLVSGGKGPDGVVQIEGASLDDEEP